MLGPLCSREFCRRIAHSDVAGDETFEQPVDDGRVVPPRGIADRREGGLAGAVTLEEAVDLRAQGHSTRQVAESRGKRVNYLQELQGQGFVPMSRIDDAVVRILTQKFELGMFEQPFTDRSTQSQINSPAHVTRAPGRGVDRTNGAGGLAPAGRTLPLTAFARPLP